MIDPRLDILASEAGEPTTTEQAKDALMRAAEALALMGGDLSPGEARTLFCALTHTWVAPPPSEWLESTARWASERAKVMASRAQDVAGELQSHLGAQADGRYALAPWPWPMLTRESRSLMPGSVTLICGTPGASKSWFALSCLRHWTAMGLSAQVLMLEETRKWHLQRALAQCAQDPNLLKPEWIAANRDKAMEVYRAHEDELAAIRARLTCDGDWTMAKCAEWVEQQCKAGVRVIIVDPISLADPGTERSWDADRRFMARSKVAVEKAGASLVLITHPRKQSGKVGPPELDDLAGGAAFGRACGSALWVAGINGHDPTAIITEDGRCIEDVPHKSIRIMKARNSTGAGKCIVYAFRGLAFDELGELTGKGAQGRPANASHQRDRIAQKPSPGEDLF